MNKQSLQMKQLLLKMRHVAVLLLLAMFWSGASFGQTLTITDNGSANATWAAGTASTQVLQTFKVSNTVATAGTFTVNIPITYSAASDITDVKLYSTSNLGIVPNAVNGSSFNLAGTITTLPASGSNFTFTAVPFSAAQTSLGAVTATLTYYYLVVDFSASGVTGHTVAASALISSNFSSLSSGTISTAAASPATLTLKTAANYYWNGANATIVPYTGPTATPTAPSAPLWSTGYWSSSSTGMFTNTAANGSTLPAIGTSFNYANLSNPVAGNTIVLSTGALANTGTINVTSTTHTLTSTSTGTTATVAAPINLATNSILTVSPYNPSGNVPNTFCGITLSGPITGAGGLTIGTTAATGNNGAGTQGANVAITGNCNYTGATQIGSGTVVGSTSTDPVGANAQIITSGNGVITNSPITIAYGSQLYINNAGTAVNPTIWGSSANPVPTMTVNGASNSTNSGALRVKPNVTYYGNFKIGNSIANAANITTWTISGGNTYWGGTQSGVGTVQGTTTAASGAALKAGSSSFPSALPTYAYGFNIYGALQDDGSGSAFAKQGGGTMCLFADANNDANTISGNSGQAAWSHGNGSIVLEPGAQQLVGTYTSNGTTYYGAFSLAESSSNTPMLFLYENATIGNLSSTFVDAGSKGGGEAQGIYIDGAGVSNTGLTNQPTKTLTIYQTTDFEYGSNGYYGPNATLSSVSNAAGSFATGGSNGTGSKYGQSSYLFGAGSISKYGTAALKLTSTNDLYTGTITVNEGVLAIDNGGSALNASYSNPNAIVPGSIAGNVVLSGVSAADPAYLVGVGGVGFTAGGKITAATATNNVLTFGSFTGYTATGGVTLGQYGILSPGTSISLNAGTGTSPYAAPNYNRLGQGVYGTLYVGKLNLNGGTYYVDMNSLPTGTPGINWDNIVAAGITNNSGATISLNGTIASFVNTSSYTWTIGTYTGSAPATTGITVSNNLSLTGTTSTGTWSIAFSGGNINLVYTPPAVTFTTQPATASSFYCLNSTATALTVAAVSGSASFTYQWYSNTTASTTGGTSLGSANGAQTASYTPQTASAGTTYYYCVVTNTTTSTSLTSNVSGDINVTSSVTPTLSLGSNVTVCYGSGNTFNITSQNITPSTIVWKVNGTQVASGVTSYSYTPANSDVVSASGYNTTVSASCLTTGSSSATAVSSSVTVTLNTTPGTPTAVSATNGTSGNSTVSFTANNCYDRIVVIAKESAFTSAVPTGDGTSLTASATYKAGSSFDGGYVVFNAASGTSVPVVGLANGVTYYFEVFEVKNSNWSTAVKTTATPYSAGYYWTAASSVTNLGGTGTWAATSGQYWSVVSAGSGSTTGGSLTNWTNSGAATFFTGTPGTVTVAATQSSTTEATSAATILTSGYTFIPVLTNIETIGGPINVGVSGGNAVNVNFLASNLSGNRSLGIGGGITGYNGSTLTLQGNPGTGEISDLVFSTANSVVNIPTTISGGSGSGGVIGYYSTVDGVSITGTIANSSNFATNLGCSGSGNTLSVSGILSGTQGLWIGAGYTGGAGTVYLTGNNTFTGTTTMAAGANGILKFGNANALGTNPTIAYYTGQGGILDFNGYAPTTLAFSNASYNTGTSGYITNNGSSDVILNINQSTAGQFYAGIQDGTKHVSVVMGGGTLTLAGAITTSNAITVNAGTLTLSATNTTGATVSGGTLNVTGTAGAITVGAAGTLSGTGTVGAVTNAGTISPGGSSNGTLTTGNLILSSGSSLSWGLSSSNESGKVAGVDWDYIAAGTITDNTVGHTALTVYLTGALANFDNANNYTWQIGSYTGTIATNAFSNVVFNTTGLSATPAGKFSISATGGVITLAYNAYPTIPEDVTVNSGDVSFPLVWNAPANSATANITSYTVYVYATATSTTPLAYATTTTLPTTSSPFTVSAANLIVYGTASTVFTPVTGSNYYFGVAATNAIGTGAISTLIKAGSSATTTWNGTSWSYGPPVGTSSTTTQNVIINGNLTTAQLVAAGGVANFYCNHLTIQSGTFSNTGTITIVGSGTTFTNNSTISGGTVVLGGTSAQYIAGTGIINSLTINNNSGVYVTAGSGNNVGITGTLSLLLGRFTTNTTGYTTGVTLKSTGIATTGILAPYGVTSGGITYAGTLSGNVNVERNIPKGFRAFRDLAPEVYNASNTIYSTWQENGSFANNGYGMFITGPSATDATVSDYASGQLAPNSNGLDYSLNGAASAYTYTNSTGTWNSGITNTKTTLDPFQGYRVLVRGDRTFNLATTPVGQTNGSLLMINSTSLRATGQLITGTVTYNTSGVSNTSVGVSNNAADALNATEPTVTTSNGVTTYSGGFSMIANPYACPVLWGTGTTTNGSTTVYGSSSGINASFWYLDPTQSASGTYIANNAITGSVYNVDAPTYIQPGQAVFVVNTNNNPSVIFTEYQKQPASTKTTVFGVNSSSSKLYVALMKQQDNSYNRVDGVAFAFNSAYSNTLGNEDAIKFNNAKDNIFINKDGNKLSIDGRQPVTESDVISLGLGQLSGTEYQLQIDGSKYTGLQAYLVDAYKGTTTALENGINTISFTVDASVSASFQNRFSIVFKTATTVAATVQTATCAFYPNPVVGKVANLKLSNAAAAKYVVSIYNQLGEVVSVQSINHVGGTANHSLNLNKMAAGVYSVSVRNASNGQLVSQTKLFVQH